MATIAFALVGGAIGGSLGFTGTAATIAVNVGAAVGTVIGGVVDQMLIYPAVFGRKNQRMEGPKLDDTQLFTASEGSLMNYVLGTVRCSGTLIWADEVEDVQIKDHQGGGKGFGGGGGGGVTTVQHVYYTSFAIGICEGQIAKIDKIFADGKLIFTKDGFTNLLLWSDAFQKEEWFRKHCDIAWNVDDAPAGSGLVGQLSDKLTATMNDAQCGQKGVKVKPNTTYTFSFWAKRGTMHNPRLTIWDDSNDKYLVKEEIYFPGEDEYVRVTRTFTTPNDCYKLDVYILDHCDSVESVTDPRPGIAADVIINPGDDIQAKIDASAVGNRIKFTNGTYTVSSQITLLNNRTYFAETHWGAIIDNTSMTDNAFKITGANITIWGLKFVGAGIRFVSGAGSMNNHVINNCAFDVRDLGPNGCTGIIFESERIVDVQIINCSFNPILPGGGAGIYGYYWTNLLIANNEFMNGTEGVHLIDHSDSNTGLLIEQNYIAHLRRLAIEIQGGPIGSIIQDNYYELPTVDPVYNNNLDLFAYSIIADRSQNTIIRRNYCNAPERDDGTGLRVIFETGGDNCRCYDNYTRYGNHVCAANDFVGTTSVWFTDNNIQYQLLNPSGRGLTQDNNGPDVALTWDIERGRPYPNQRYGNSPVINELIVVVDPITDITATLYVFGAQLEQGSAATDYDRTEDISFAEDKQYDSLTGYNGSETQMPDPVMEAIMGAGNVPAYRGTAYVVFERFKLTNWGNRIPQFTFQITQNKKLAVKDAIGLICDHARFEFYDKDRVGAGTLQGLLVSGPQVPARLLEQIMMTYDLLAQETNGTIYFFARGHPRASQYMEIPTKELSAREDGTDPTRGILFTDIASTEIPAAVVINYLDKTNSFQRGSTREQVRHKLTDNVLVLDLPMTFDPDTVRTIAKRLLWTSQSERQTVSFTMTPSMMQLQEGDAFKVSRAGQVFYCRITEATRGNNHIIEVKGTVEMSKTLGVKAKSMPLLNIFEQTVYQPGEVFLVMADIPALRDEDTSVPGFYFGAAPNDVDDQWRGISLLSSSNGIDYTALSATTVRATVGKATSVLPAAATEYGFDRVSSVVVQLKYGELESIPEGDVANGSNWILIGNEIIGFADAQLVNTKSYLLSTLLRGLRGTTPYMNNHVSDESVMLLNSTIEFVPANASIFGQPRQYKAVPADAIAEEFKDNTTLTLQGVTLKPLPPVQVAVSRDGSNNATFSWTYSTRSLSSVFGPAGIMRLPDETNNYEIDVYHGPTIVRTISATGATTATYSAANQTSDGLTPGDPISFAIYQLSTVVGRGVGRRFSL